MTKTFWTYFIVCNVLISISAVGFEYTHFNHKCRDVSNHNLILTLNVNSLNKCVKQCWVRKKCLSVIFKRLFPMCELYSVDVAELTPVHIGTSCIVVRREDIHETEVKESFELVRSLSNILYCYYFPY